MSVDASHPNATEWDRLQRGALIAGTAALALCAVSALVRPAEWFGSYPEWPAAVRAVLDMLFDRAQFFRSYLVACVFWLGVALGCLAIVMLHRLTGGAWGIVIRRLLESATRTLPLLVLLFVPLVAGLPYLYSWADPERVPALDLAPSKQVYLSVPFFLIRAGIYFLAWLGLMGLLNYWSREQDRTADPTLERRFRLLSAAGLVLYGLTVTFASIDWVMSLEPKWYSTIYGVLFATGQVLAAFAFTITLLARLAIRSPLAEAIGPAHLRDLGSLLLAFVMLWAYLAFSQFLVIWSGNLPDEIPWYLRRWYGGWQWVGLALILFHFALPFLLLLSRDVKNHPWALGLVAGAVLFMRYVDLFWLIMPAFFPGDQMPEAGFHLHWLDLAAGIGVGGVWFAWFLWQLKQMPLLPIHDPYLAEAIANG